MSGKRHALLERQLRKHLPQPPEGQAWEAFMDAVSASYQHFDAEHELLNRSIELSTDELMAKNAELRQKNEALDSFVYRVAHDLRSPISNIQAMLTMLRDLIATDEQSPIVTKVLQNLNASAKNLGVRVTDLLDMTKLERRLVSPVETLEFQSLVDEIVFNLGAKILDTGAKVEADFSAYPVINYARENLMSVLGNLIENAIKYRDPARSPLIQITASETPDGLCCVQISDNGLGIDLAKAGGRLFGLFNRMHSHVEGSGVGLYLVKKIVEQNGGAVFLESTPGVGTTFKLHLKNDSLTPEIDPAR